MTAKRYDPSIDYEMNCVMDEDLEGEYVTYEAYKGERVKYLAMLEMNKILSGKIQESKL